MSVRLPGQVQYLASRCDCDSLRKRVCCTDASGRASSMCLLAAASQYQSRSNPNSLRSSLAAQTPSSSQHALRTVPRHDCELIMELCCTWHNQRDIFCASISTWASPSSTIHVRLFYPSKPTTHNSSPAHILSKTPRPRRVHLFFPLCRVLH
jgi:hypothetical protein